MANIIKAQFLRDGKPISREYSYLTKEPVNVGDIVLAEVKQGTAELLVTAINVPEEEVAEYKDRLKYIIGKKPDAVETER
jgi:hypothetical protein